MSIPEAHITWSAPRHVDFDELGTRQDIGDGEEHIDNLYSANIARLADLNDWYKVILVLELASGGTNFRPDFTVEPESCQHDYFDQEGYNLGGALTLFRWGS